MNYGSDQLLNLIDANPIKALAVAILIFLVSLILVLRTFKSENPNISLVPYVSLLTSFGYIIYTLLNIFPTIKSFTSNHQSIVTGSVLLVLLIAMGSILFAIKRELSRLLKREFKFKEFIRPYTRPVAKLRRIK